MKFIIIFGPPAVGKMSVGTELAKLSGLKLFHNHMSIELVLNFFDFGEKGFKRLDKLIRNEILKEIAQSELKGVIFTYVWALDVTYDADYLNEFIHHFEEVGGEIIYVELAADLDNRLLRNKHPHRLAEKASKRDLKRSEEALLYHEKKYRFNSHEGEFNGKKHIKINNNDLSPAEVAQRIMKEFNL